MTLLGCERKRERRKGLIKLSESACISLSWAQCAPDASLLVPFLINVSVISQHVYCISLDVFNFGAESESDKLCHLPANDGG